MFDRFVYNSDKKEEAKNIIREWFHGDNRIAFRLDEEITVEDGYTRITPVLTAIVPSFSDGQLFTFYKLKQGDVVEVTRRDVWPVIVVKSDNV